MRGARDAHASATTPALTSSLPGGALLPTAAWLLVAASGAASLSLMLVPLARRLGLAYGLVDHPGEARRIHRVPTPRAGGIGVFSAVAVILGLAALLPLPAALAPRPLLLALAGGGGILLLVGVVDDRFGVRPRIKLLGQISAAALAWGVGFRPDMPFAGHPVLDLLFFVVWVLGVTNAFNLIDGMDGLAGTVALVAMVAVAVYGALLGNLGVLLPCVVLGGAVVGFLRYNLAPASVFLGDAGSLTIGFAIAVLSLAGAEHAGGAATLLMPICAIPVPVLDTGMAIVRRWLRHVPLSSADARHIHHRLGALGYGPRGVVAVLFVVSSLVAAFGIVVGLAPRESALALGIFGAIILGRTLLYGCSRLAYHEINEAANIVLSAPRRARRVIRSQIVVRDIAHELEAVRDVPAVRRLLADRAIELGFLQLALAPVSGSLQLHPLAGGDVWRLEYPLDARDEHGAALFLVVTSERGPLADAGTAERVVRALAPAVEVWFATHVRPVEAHPWVEPVAVGAEPRGSYGWSPEAAASLSRGIADGTPVSLSARGGRAARARSGHR